MEETNIEYPQYCGNETILLADDNSEIRKVLSSIMSCYGYNVICAHDGHEAVDTFKEHSDKIQLVIMDVMMPRKNGIDAFHEIREVRQGIKAIFMGGYSPNMFHLFESDATYLEKPLDLIVLMKTIRETLN